ncbi:MAG: PorT family protein [Cytophagales bacterium]|nr:PorT family protein [Cytophagales bacterium]
MSRIQMIKKVLLGILLAAGCLAALPGQAQNTKRQSLYSLHLADYDDKTIHYGFFIAGHTSTLNRRYSDNFVNGLDTMAAANTGWGVGYGLGFIVAYGLDPQFDVCLVPAFAYYERPVQYISTSGAVRNQSVESGFIELSMLARYKSVRRGNVRMYMLGGIKPGVEVGSNIKSRGLNSLRTRNWDVSVEYGFGFDLFYPYFKFSPELRFSHGLSNLLVKENNIYSRTLNRLGAHSVSLYLYF